MFSRNTSCGLLGFLLGEGLWTIPWCTRLAPPYCAKFVPTLFRLVRFYVVLFGEGLRQRPNNALMFKGCLFYRSFW